ncbi:MAG: PadR family transcriptional regulator [Oscillospiraceae bacterium]|jgi:PadR family transcriptional regulator PadR|nr:PadR family transcriptional regulator [Oscillospiraceae bacterium]
MEQQLKRGLLEVCVLASLERGDSYGYKLVKDIGACVEISESTLYPILKRLEVGGMVTVYSVEHNSRLRKYYRLTTAGRERIEGFLEEWKAVMDVYEFIKRGGQTPAMREVE